MTCQEFSFKYMAAEIRSFVHTAGCLMQPLVNEIGVVKNPSGR